jgi:hypothetical protein
MTFSLAVYSHLSLMRRTFGDILGSILLGYEGVTTFDNFHRSLVFPCRMQSLREEVYRFSSHITAGFTFRFRTTGRMTTAAEFSLAMVSAHTVTRGQGETPFFVSVNLLAFLSCVLHCARGFREDPNFEPCDPTSHLGF